MTQERLAEVIGINRTYVGAVERGERNLRLQTVERLCELLGVDAAVMLTAPAAYDPMLRAAASGDDPGRRASRPTVRPSSPYELP